MRDPPSSPHLQLSPDFQRTLCRQAQKQVPEGTVGIWAFRGKRRDWNSHFLSVFYVLSTLLIVMSVGWGCTQTLVQRLICHLLTLWSGQASNFSALSFPHR